MGLPCFVPNNVAVFSSRRSAFLQAIVPGYNRTLCSPTLSFSAVKKSIKRHSAPIIFASAGSPNAKNTTAVPLAPPVSDIWELDFYSRPVVGLDGKKLWELIITDTSGSFEYIEAVPNTMVNSRELRKRIEAAMKTATRMPTTIRFFRSQMFNMIQIALSELDVTVNPSRKTYALYKLIKQRETSVYANMPGYKPSAATSLSSPSASISSFASFDFSMAKPLPDALRCEKFAFGNFPLGQLEQFFDEANPTDFCGDQCPIDDDLEPDQIVPGLVVFSRRAKALAAWINGIELAYIKAMTEQREVVLECGLNTVYRFAQIDDTLKGDVRKFESLKANGRGLHFLAVQESADSEEVEGMWLLCEL